MKKQIKEEDGEYGEEVDEDSNPWYMPNQKVAAKQKELRNQNQMIQSRMDQDRMQQDEVRTFIDS